MLHFSALSPRAEGLRRRQVLPGRGRGAAPVGWLAPQVYVEVAPGRAMSAPGGGIRLSLSLKDPGPGLPPFGLQGGLSWNRSARGDPVTQQPWLCVTRGKFLPEPVSLSVSPCGPSWRTWDRQPHCSATAREGKGADGLSKDLSSGSKVRETWVCGFGQSYYISGASISPLAKRVSDSATSGV